MTFWDFIYQYYNICNYNENVSEDLYLELEDINNICKYIIETIDTDPLCNFVNNEVKVELLTYDRLEPYKYYAKVNKDKIKHIFKDNDNRYYTYNKINIEDILEFKMKNISDYIKEQQILETLFYSLSNSTIIDKLSKIFNISKDKIKILKTKSKDYSQISFNKKDIELNNQNYEDELRAFANLCGYKLILKDDLDKIILEPFHPVECSNKIYNEFDGIIYHITSKYFWEKIQNNKYIPLRSSFGFNDNDEFDINGEYKDKSKNRLYIFSGKSLKDIRLNLKSFSNLSGMINKLRHKDKLSKYYDKNTILKIKLPKDSNIKFYYDPAYQLSNNTIAAFTKDNIQVDWIEEIYDIKNI